LIQVVQKDMRAQLDFSRICTTVFILLLIAASPLCGEPRPSLDLRDISTIKQQLNLEKIPDDTLRDILSVQIEFRVAGTDQRTTIGHWISGVLRTLDYGTALREGVKTGKFRQDRERYFNAILDRNLDPVWMRRGLVRDAAAEAFAHWGDRLGGGSSLSVLKGGADLWVLSINVIETYATFSAVIEQERDASLATYFDLRDSPEPEEQAWNEVMVALPSYGFSRENYREFLRVSYEAYRLSADPSAVVTALRNTLEGLMPWKPTAARLLNSDWTGTWTPESKDCPNSKSAGSGPFPSQPITIELSSELGQVWGRLSGPGILAVGLSGPNSAEDLNLTINLGRHAEAGAATLHLQGYIMTGHINESTVSGYCNWKGPFEARLSLIRNAPASR
jgi:hypothetical protein